MFRTSEQAIKWIEAKIKPLSSKTLFFPDPWLKVPKAQKIQGQGLANGFFKEYGSFATDVVGRVCVLTDVTRLNFFEVARAAFFSKYLVRGTW